MIIDKAKIKAVIFDWGGVCCKEGEPFASLALQRVLNMNPEQIADKARDIYNGYYVGKYNRDSFWQAIIKHFNLKETAEINPLALSQAYLDSYKIYPEALEVARKFKENGLLVGLLSNLTPEMRDYVRPLHHTAEFFNPEIYSCDEDIKCMKPDIKPYMIILKRMKVRPQQCLFIDNSKKNLVPAEQLGMQTVFFENTGQFLQDISYFL